MVEEIQYKPRNLKGEIKPIIAILEDEDSEDKSVAQIADEIVTALDEVRSAKNMVAIIARVSYDGGASWTFFTMGPYKSKAVAKAKGEALNRGGAPWECKWLMFDMVKDYGIFLKSLAPSDEKASAWEGEVPSRLIEKTVWTEPGGGG